MLFSIDKKNNAVLHPDAVKLCPALGKLEENDLMFIILAYDYYSPFHQFPVEERVRKASGRAYGRYKDSVNLIESSEEYRSLQYDSKREMINKYQQKVNLLGTKLLAADDAREIKEIDTAIELLLSRTKEIQQQIDAEEEVYRIKGGGTTSFIEKWQQNRAVFNKEEDYRSNRKGIVALGEEDD